MSFDEYGNQYDDEGVLLLPPDLQEIYDRGGFSPGEAEALARAYRGSSPTQIPTSERVKDVTYVPPEPVGIPFVPRERPAGPSFKFGREEYNTPLIAGYGRRMALIKPEAGRAGATNDYGQPVSEEYLKDMEDTMAAFYRGDISEEQLKVKGGIPAKPTDQQLSITEQKLRNRQDTFDKMKETGFPIPNPQSAREEAESAIQRSYNEGLQTSDIVLRKPKEAAQINAHARIAGQSAFQHEQTRYDALVNHIDKDFNARYEADYKKGEEERKNARELAEKQAADKLKREERQEDAWQIVGDQKVNKYTGEVKDIPGLKKPSTSVDLKRLSDMVAIATRDKGGNLVEPSVSDVAIISDMADKAGYEFKKLTGKSAEYGLPGIDKPLWGGKETSEWRLVPKGSEKSTASAVSESDLIKDLMSHGHSKSSAEAYIKKAKVKGKL